ncbi:Glycosyltransferase domain [Methylophilaceae bacterium]
MVNRITIIIPTYERPQFIKRALYYWSAYPVNVIVIDGSRAPSVNADDFILPINVQYYHLPISIEERFSFAASKISGEYAALISDDEFLSYSALKDATNILDDDEDVSAVLGVTIGFNKVKKQFLCSMLYQSAEHLDITGQTAKIRINQRIRVAENSIFYPLVRVEVLKIALKFIGEYHYSCPYVAEYQMEAILCAAGAVKVMPALMWFRSFEVSMISNDQHNRAILFSKWLNDPKNVEDLEKLKLSATEYFSKLSKYDKSLDGSQFVNFFEKFEKMALKSRANPSKIKRFYTLIPENLKTVIRPLIHFLIGKSPSALLPLSRFLDDLKTTNIRFDPGEINRIQNIVLNNMNLTSASKLNESIPYVN